MKKIFMILLFALNCHSFQNNISPERVLRLEPNPGNPRNSEGDFVQLQDGRILFVYSHFTGGAGDDDEAYLAGRFSKDNGLHWSEDVTILPNKPGENLMSVSLLRLRNGKIALFYLRKFGYLHSAPCVRFSEDEAKTWSDEIRIINDPQGYFVINNDRVIQLKSGRILVPVATHYLQGWEREDMSAIVSCYISDDDGKKWRSSKTQLAGKKKNGKKIVIQEPGVAELFDGRILLFCRTDAGSQYLSFSSDQGDSWSPLEPSAIISPLSPAAIERIPEYEKLLLVWNDHSRISAELKGKRTPLCLALSDDNGKTWRNRVVLEDDPFGWFCYPAIYFFDNFLLLSYCAGDRRTGNFLGTTQIVRLDKNLIVEH